MHILLQLFAFVNSEIQKYWEKSTLLSK